MRALVLGHLQLVTSLTTLEASAKAHIEAGDEEALIELGFDKRELCRELRKVNRRIRHHCQVHDVKPPAEVRGWYFDNV